MSHGQVQDRGRTALLAWELGMGLGHARRLLAIASALKARGWAPVVAARELWACAREYRDANIPLLQAPIHRGLTPREGVKFRARGFADILAAAGFRDVQALLPTVLGWDGLIDLVRPDVIVADYSPILSLAAYSRIPVLAIGDGFVLPPEHLPKLPVLRSAESEMPDDRTLLANAASIQRQRGAPVPQTLPSLIGGDARVVCTYPETDIYAALRLEPAIGPIDHALTPLDRPAKSALFAYLAAGFGPTMKLLQALAASRFPLEAFVRDIGEEAKRGLREMGVRVHDAPPRLSDVAARASVIVHHGGIGTAEAAVALGRPQLLLPSHFEQSLNASRLLRLGVATSLRANFSPEEASQSISEAMSSDMLAHKAQETAARVARRPGRSLERIVELCNELAGGAS